MDQKKPNTARKIRACLADAGIATSFSYRDYRKSTVRYKYFLTGNHVRETETEQVADFLVAAKKYNLPVVKAEFSYGSLRGMVSLRTFVFHVTR